MKTYFIVSYLLPISTTFASPTKPSEISLIEDETSSLFQHYLTNCRNHDMINQPVYLQKSCQEMSQSSNDMTILSLDPSLTMQINDISARILYGDADVVNMRNISTAKASHLYEVLQKNYTYFIYVPFQEQGLFVASSSSR